MENWVLAQGLLDVPESSHGLRSPLDLVGAPLASHVCQQSSPGWEVWYKPMVAASLPKEWSELSELETQPRKSWKPIAPVSCNSYVSVASSFSTISGSTRSVWQGYSWNISGLNKIFTCDSNQGQRMSTRASLPPLPPQHHGSDLKEILFPCVIRLSLAPFP